MDQIKELAAPLEGKRVLHLSATAFGSGVAEILYADPAHARIGARDRVARDRGQDEFFNVTKAIHNGLQGDPADITEDGKRVFREYNKRNAEALEERSSATSSSTTRNRPASRSSALRTGRWIWRCRLDLSEPNQKVLNFLHPDALRVRRDRVPPARVRAAHQSPARLHLAARDRSLGA